MVLQLAITLYENNDKESLCDNNNNKIKLYDYNSIFPQVEEENDNQQDHEDQDSLVVEAVKLPKAALTVPESAAAVSSSPHHDNNTIKMMMIKTIRRPCTITTPNPLTIAQNVPRSVIKSFILKHQIIIANTSWAVGTLQCIINFKKLPHKAKKSLVFITCAYISAYLKALETERTRLDESKAKARTSITHAITCVTSIKVRKHGRRGAPHETRLGVNTDKTDGTLSSISWDGKLSSSKKLLKLVDIVDIKVGATTVVFAKAKKVASFKPKCCFSIITNDRTLDLEARTVEARDWLITSLQQILQYAEKQRQVASRHVELCMMTRIKKLRNVIKHGRRGLPHVTTLAIQKTGDLSWSSKVRKSATSGFPLDDITAIVPGKTTPVFNRRRRLINTRPSDGVPSSVCLSVLTAERTLDLQLETEADRDWLIVALTYLSKQCATRRAHLQRQRAAMLQQQNSSKSVNINTKQ